MKDFLFAEDVASAVSREECQRLSELAGDRVVLEVGSQFGRSTLAMASTATRVHAVDWHLGDKHAGFLDSLPELMRNLERYKLRDRVVVHVGRNEVVLPMLLGNLFDLAFIDSFHERAAVESDTAMVLRLMKPGGAIAFHDFGIDGFAGLTRAVEEFAGREGLKIDVVRTLAIVRLK
jgi:predicted O-methyltransferase YrrM